MINAASELLAATLSRSPDKTALLWPDGALSYRELWDNARRFGNLLRAKGLVPGDRVLLVLPDTPAFFHAFLGSVLAGICPVAVSTAVKTEDYAFYLEDSGAGALVSVPGHAAMGIKAPLVLACSALGPEGLALAPPDLSPSQGDPERLAFMLYSSGTTGRPKGVPHSHADLLWPSRSWGTEILALSAADTVFSASKLYFAYGLLASLAMPLAAGAGIVLFPDKPDPYALFEVIAKQRPTVFFSVPTVYNLMLRALDDSAKLDSLRLCFSAGEALPLVIAEEWARQTGIEILDGIGSTEAFNVFISNRSGQVRPGSSGRPLTGYEAKLVDDAGGEVQPGEKGHLLMRGPGFARGYWNRPDKTAETMLAQGWIRTGDVYLVMDGCFFHQGRGDDMLKVGAHWVSPIQIEEALLEHPGVAEAAVSVCRISGLERPCAHVVARPGQAPDAAFGRELRRHILSRLPDYMCPVRFEFPAELPKTPTGKIQRFKLKEAVPSGTTVA